MTTPLRRRLRAAVPSAALAATIFVPLLLTRPGRVGADTKSYLYLDPGRLLSRAGSLWDPGVGLGTVTHQNVGYLWPIGPYYWLADAIGLPDWVAQRIWLGAILVTAGIGVRFMLKAMGQIGPHVTATTFCYALTPYVLTLGSRLSVILLPYAGLPWLIGLTVLALRRRRWREPAAFALVVATIGSINATALILVGVGPVLWVLHEVYVVREVRFRDALATTARIGVLTIGCSVWWMSGLWAQSGYGIDILRYTETAETVASASMALEVLRGLGYWFFYGEDRYGPWIAPSPSYMAFPMLALSYALPGLGVAGAVVSRFRERAFFLLLLVAGLVLAVGAHPWDGGPIGVRAMRAFLESDTGLAMRSLPRAAPLVVLALSVFLGSLIASIAARRHDLARPLTAAAMIIAVLALPPLLKGQMADRNLDRPEDIPDYWPAAASYLDGRGDATRVLEVPGSDFASYRWGNTVDPVLPGLMDRPYVARELIPYGSPASADLLNALDHRLQEQILDPRALAPTARFMGVGDLSVRSDLTYERYNTPRPRPLWDLLRHAEGIGTPTGFGPGDRNRPRADLPLLDEQELAIDPALPDPPEVGILPVADAEPIIRTAPQGAAVVLAGNGDGLVDAASAGLLSGHELLVYSASFARDRAELRDVLGADGVLVLTDSNRRQGRSWSTVRDNLGIIERADQDPLVVDPTDQRLPVFPDAGDDAYTVRDARGAVSARATSYGNAVSLTPEDDPSNAIDGSNSTAWRTGGFANADGESLELTYRQPVTTDHVRLLQAVGGVRTRTISKVRLRFDDGPTQTYDLDDSSMPENPGDDPEAGQSIDVGLQTFRTLTVTIDRTRPDGVKDYAGLSAVGFSEVGVIDADGTRPLADDVVRLPVDLLEATGDASLGHDLAVVLTRQRVAGNVAVRSDPERSLIRSVELPGARDFALTGQVRLSNRVLGDNVIDQALGLPDADAGGITATSSRRLPGGLANRASAAIDGDPTTWWSPGFLNQTGEYLDYRTATPVTVDDLDLSVLADGRHSVPTTLLVTVDGPGSAGSTQRITVPPIADRAEPNAVATVQVRLPEPATGTHVRVTIAPEESSVRVASTLDWFTGRPVTLPVAIVDLGISGLQVAAPPARIDDTCRTDLVTLDGEPVPVSVSGTTADLLAGKAVTLRDCVDGGVTMDAGTSTLRTTVGALTGLDLDRLVLRSAPGGAADRATGLLQTPDAAAAPKVQVDAQSSTTADLTVPAAPVPFWLVLGQSHNEGWTATADGKDLGAPTLVDGYANGWRVPAGTDIEIRLAWTPQRVVRWAFLLSALSVLAAVALLAWPRRAAAIDDERRVALDAEPSMPRPFQWERVLRYAGPDPSRFALIVLPLASLVLGSVVIGPIPGVVLALAALVALRVERSRPLLTLGGPLLLAGCMGFQVLRQYVGSYPSGFDWPGYFEVIHQPTWTAIALVLLDAFVDRCWLRRWWPTRDSPA